MVDAQRWPGAVFLGLTATPFRSDNKGLGEFYKYLVPPTRTARQLVEQGHLIAPLMKGADPSTLPDLSDLLVSGQDYDKEALGAKMADPKIGDDLFDAACAAIWALVTRGVNEIPVVVGRRVQTREQLLGTPGKLIEVAG